MKKRVVRSVMGSAAAVMFTASFIGTSLPMTAAEDIALTIETLTEDDSIEVFTNRKSEENSELLYNYMLTQSGVTPGYDRTKNGKPVFYSAGITAGEKLTGNNALVYDYLKTQIQDIASGERTSSLIEVPLSVFGIKDGPWSASELGVKSVYSNGKYSDEAVENLRAKIDCDFEAIVTALLADCPYDLYWCDKTSYRFSSGGNMRATRVGGVYYLTLTSVPVLELYVSADYAEGNETGTTYMPDDRLSAVTAAINNAKDIVESNSDKQGKELLDAYRKAICDAVKYNHDTGTDYGDPWQLIYVFDGDDSTDVVCEGYAKAFKYLCDLSADRLENISCLIATGTSSAPHMWNIVNMDDDRSYLVDITQCDSAEYEIPEFIDTFFLGTPVSGSFSTTYKFRFPGAKYYEGGYVYTYSARTIDYTYDDDTKATYNTAYLTLSTEPYTEPAEEPPVQDNTDYAVSLSVSNKTYDGKTVSPSTYIYRIGDSSRTAVSISGADISCTYYKYDGSSSITEDYINSLTPLNGAPKDAGTYIVKASASAEGYVFENVYSSFSINRKSIAVVPAVSGKTFGDSDPDFSNISYSRSAVVKGDTVNISGAYSLEGYNGNAGSYKVTAGTLECDNNNYRLAVSGNFTVEPYTLTNDNIKVLGKAVPDNEGWAYPADSVSVNAVLYGQTAELEPAVYDSRGNYISGDYKVLSAEKTNTAGNFTFVIEGVGNYSGSGEAVVEVVSGNRYVTVKNGTLKGGGTEGYFKTNAVAVATADKAADGYKFGYWKRNGVTISYNPVYTFYVTSEITELEAVYLEDTDDIEKYGNAQMESVTPDKANGKIQFVSILNVPENCKIIRAGIVATSNAEKGASLTAENADYVRYDANVKYHNYKYTWTKTNVASAQTWYVKGYLVYEDANGNQKTVYSALTKATLNGSETIKEDKIVGTAVMESVTPYAAEKRIVFVAMLNVPADCTIKQAGIVATSNADKAKNLTAENADYVRADATTKHGYRYTWTKTGVTSRQTWYVRPYLVYTDANGKTWTVYGDTATGKLS